MIRRRLKQRCNPQQRSGLHKRDLCRSQVCSVVLGVFVCSRSGNYAKVSPDPSGKPGRFRMQFRLDDVTQRLSEGDEGL